MTNGLPLDAGVISRPEIPGDSVPVVPPRKCDSVEI